MGGNIQMCLIPTSEEALKLAHLETRRGTFISVKNVRTYFKVHMRVAAPETQNNTSNPRKSVVCITCHLNAAVCVWM